MNTNKYYRKIIRIQGELLKALSDDFIRESSYEVHSRAKSKNEIAQDSPRLDKISVILRKLKKIFFPVVPRDQGTSEDEKELFSLKKGNRTGIMYI
ncbi:hypothetical protein GCM10009597_32570 [Peribacillus frigoritolerans]